MIFKIVSRYSFSFLFISYTNLSVYLRATGGEVGATASLAPKIGPLGLSPKKVGDDIAKATQDWKGLRITVKLTIQNRLFSWFWFVVLSAVFMRIGWGRKYFIITHFIYWDEIYYLNCSSFKICLNECFWEVLICLESLNIEIYIYSVKYKMILIFQAGDCLCCTLSFFPDHQGFERTSPRQEESQKQWVDHSMATKWETWVLGSLTPWMMLFMLLCTHYSNSVTNADYKIIQIRQMFSSLWTCCGRYFWLGLASYPHLFRSGGSLLPPVNSHRYQSFFLICLIELFC